MPHEQPNISASFPAQSFYHFENMCGLCTVYRDLLDRLKRQKATDSAEPGFFDEILNFRLESTASCLSQGLTVPKQYFNVMCTFSYETNDKERLWKRKYRGRLERALEKLSSLFFHGAKILLGSVVNIAPSVNRLRILSGTFPWRLFLLI